MNESFWERFWRIVCQSDGAMVMLLLAQVVFFLLLLFSAFTARDPTTRLVLQIDFVIVVATTVLVGGALWNCRRRQRR